MASEQDLNSLARFRKQSVRLVLEEHGHCEVPAGCGGVVLRWRDPFAVVPLTLHLHTPVPAACFLDGAEVRTGRVDLAPGQHAVAFALENVSLAAGLILFAASHLETHTRRTPPARLTEPPLHVLTADDGTWRCTLSSPATDDWKLANYDDHAWIVLTRAPTPHLDSGATGAYQCGECVRQGAICLGLPGPKSKEESSTWWQRLLGQPGPGPAPPKQGSVWIRKVFAIPPPQPRGPS